MTENSITDYESYCVRCSELLKESKKYAMKAETLTGSPTLESKIEWLTLKLAGCQLALEYLETRIKELTNESRTGR